jgi:hypothetical protein
MPCLVRYIFSQRFAVPARKAYKWCTSYTPADLALMGNGISERRIMQIADSTILLTDIIPTAAGAIEKQKIVHLYPDTLSWVATHLSGPNKYSQFLYKISAEDDGASRLDFTALCLHYDKENLNRSGAKLLAEHLCKNDSEIWRILAKAMAKDFGFA